MKQIINNKLFDTAKARLLCESFCMLAENNKLYVTESGVFFFQKQNPISKEYYLVPAEKERVAGLLAEKNPDAYMEFFGKVEEA